MADVSPPPVPGSDPSLGGPRDSERGQLFLVGALALSVILVTLAVLLNTAIYTGNVATRDPGTGSADVIEYRTAANEMAGRTLSGVNSESHANYDALETDFEASIDAWSVAATRHSVVKGTDAYTTVINTPTSGTRIVQDTNRAFTNAGDTPDWELASGVHVRKFELSPDWSTVVTFESDPGLSELDESTFHVQIQDSDSSVYWEVYVYKYDSAAWVEVVKNDGSRTSIGECSTTTSNPVIDLTGATFAGSSCDALTFWGETDGAYDVWYHSGDTANGEYSLVVDDMYSTLESTGYYNTDGSTSPYITRALYSAEVEVVYRSPTVDYSTQFRVAPGEYDG